ncbi:non-specific lipid transfer protein GPI-anchored 31-like [Mangifera indica]|uniref:non-specific lipid transfer protein GPI-anchored 31-like n=1 Tax=Mangifera indica TaxID=29780 RepID=UPI001CFB69CC|nr:non-specific lipid transfer protein GPI-anchored 31-like [Mangifera indica]
MAKILLANCLLLANTLAAVASGSPTTPEPPAPSPSSTSTDCSTIIYNMANCVPFLSKGGEDAKPDPSCCTAFKSVLRVNAGCICEALKSSASLGIDLNMTKAATLSWACGVSASPISKCSIASPPGGAPVNPPSPPEKTPTPPPSEPSGQAPAREPSAHGGTYSTCASLEVIIMSVVVALLFRM